MALRFRQPSDDEENGRNSSWLRSVERMNRQIAGEKEPKHGHPSTRLQAMMDAAARMPGLSRLAGSNHFTVDMS